MFLIGLDTSYRVPAVFATALVKVEPRNHFAIKPQSGNNRLLPRPARRTAPQSVETHGFQRRDH
jgi:hypothetical protein